MGTADAADFFEVVECSVSRILFPTSRWMLMHCLDHELVLVYELRDFELLKP